eukprot:scaffold5852_cov68-Skeletonema_dohrnii-CCMP3373.AAC.1
MGRNNNVVKNPPVRSCIIGSGSDDPTAADAHHPIIIYYGGRWSSCVADAAGRPSRARAA